MYLPRSTADIVGVGVAVLAGAAPRSHAAINATEKTNTLQRNKNRMNPPLSRLAGLATLLDADYSLVTPRAIPAYTGAR